MSYISGESREQVYLMPEAVDDYVGPENPVRFLDVFVEKLDLATLGFTHATPADTGRPPYDPGDLLRLYLYGYLNRVRSSRRLEREASRNVEVMWLLRKLRPDFKTIADFRQANRGPIKEVCLAFTVLCKRLDLFGGELVAILECGRRSSTDSRDYLARWFRAGFPRDACTGGRARSSQHDSDCGSLRGGG